MNRNRGSPPQDHPAIHAAGSKTATEPVIQIRHVNHSFGEQNSSKRVLEDINLDVNPGEILIMSGPSGSGKTTLLTLIGAVRSVQEGTCRVLGRQLEELERQELVQVRREIGFIFQHHGLFESLTASQNVRLAMELFPCSVEEMNRRTAEILGKLGLSHRLHYRPAALSGGQRQRVAVARGLVNRPKLILADEPTAALDKEAGRDVVELFQALAAEDGSTVLIVTHDNRILDVADRILNMVDGQIVSDVAVEESIRICQFLSRCPVFSELTPAALSEVGESMTVEQYPSSSIILRQGDPGDKFYLVKEGEVEVIAEDGLSRSVLATLGEGQFFGEAALLTGEPRNATVTATRPVQLYALGKEDFQTALRASASFRQQLLAVFFQRQR